MLSGINVSEGTEYTGCGVKLNNIASSRRDI